MAPFSRTSLSISSRTNLSVSSAVSPFGMWLSIRDVAEIDHSEAASVKQAGFIEEPNVGVLSRSEFLSCIH